MHDDDTRDGGSGRAVTVCIKGESYPDDAPTWPSADIDEETTAHLRIMIDEMVARRR